MKQVRDDLDRLRGMAAMCIIREKKKLHQAETVRGVLSQTIYPHVSALRAAYERISLSVVFAIMCSGLGTNQCFF